MFLKSLRGLSYLTQKGYLSGGFCPGGLFPREGGRGLCPDTDFPSHENLCKSGVLKFPILYLPSVK